MSLASDVGDLLYTVTRVRAYDRPMRDQEGPAAREGSGRPIVGITWGVVALFSLCGTRGWQRMPKPIRHNRAW